MKRTRAILALFFLVALPGCVSPEQRVAAQCERIGEGPSTLYWHWCAQAGLDRQARINETQQRSNALMMMTGAMLLAPRPAVDVYMH